MNIVKLVILILILTVSPVLAYSDPGSGLLLLQLIGSVFVGILFYFNKIKQWIVSKVRKNDSK